MGLCPTAARIIRRVTGHTNFAHALLAITVRIASTAHTAASIGDTDRRVTTAARVIRRVTELTAVIDALRPIATVLIPRTFDAHDIAISGHADRSV